MQESLNNCGYYQNDNCNCTEICFYHRPENNGNETAKFKLFESNPEPMIPLSEAFEFTEWLMIRYFIDYKPSIEEYYKSFKEEKNK